MSTKNSNHLNNKETPSRDLKVFGNIGLLFQALMTNDDLEQMLKKSQEKQNYELCEAINKEIKRRNDENVKGEFFNDKWIEY